MSQPDFREFATHLAHLTEDEIADIRRAFEFAVKSHSGQTREDGTPYVLHVIAAAETVASWKADRDTIVAALLHDVLEDTPVKKEELAREFGRRVALLVEGITKFTQADLGGDLPLDRKVETLRKLFDVMRIDIRSILVKLADRLHNVTTIGSLKDPVRKKRFALETLNIYHKIALHLGMRAIRHTFSEYCVPYAYEDGEAMKKDRDRFFATAKPLAHVISEKLHASNAPHVDSVEVSPRNLYTFRERTIERGEPHFFDAFIVSIVVKTEDDCYSLLRLLHTLYRPVSAEFRDFIAAPSDAGYQSLHTTVSLEDGRQIEVRIRTPYMDRQAAQGITLWLFGDQKIPPNFGWLKRTEELDLKTRESSAAFYESLETDIFRRTFPVTIDGHRVSMPQGATILDAAYAAYNEKAGFLRSASIRGKERPLSSTLSDDDDVRLVFDSREHVGFDWLQMASTQHARFLIVDILKKADRSEKIALGLKLLQQELDRYGKGLVTDISRTELKSVAEHFRRRDADDVFAMIGEGVLRPREAVFMLFPEGGRTFLPHKAGGRYEFRLHITATEARAQDTLSLLNGLVRVAGVQVKWRKVKQTRDGILSILLIGSCKDRLEYADFVETLGRQEWVTEIHTLISYPQKAFLVGSFLLAFAVVGVDVFFLPHYNELLGNWTFIPKFLVQILPILPILAANYYLLRLVRSYVVRMRSEWWFLGIGLLLNVFGLVLVLLRMFLIGGIQGSLVPFVAVFVLSMVYMTFTFVQTDALLAPLDRTSRRPPSSTQWHAIRYRKIVGYSIRLVVITLWAIEPILIRYTSFNALSPLLRTFLIGLGVVFPSALLYLLRSLLTTRRLPSFRLPYDHYFFMFTLGFTGFTYFSNASLIYTSGTNWLLFTNFAPLLGLIIATIFWRREIPYLRQPRTMLAIFLLALLAGFGSSLLLVNTASIGKPWNLLGDLFAIVSTIFDVSLTIGQIEYIKHHSRTNGMLLNVHVFMFLLLITAPLLIVGSFIFPSLLSNVTVTSLLIGLGIGLLIAVGQMLNYEAFKRIDGYLAYMMLNLSILIAFVIEAFAIRSIYPTRMLIASALCIVSASVFAEYINSRAQKKGL